MVEARGGLKVVEAGPIYRFRVVVRAVICFDVLGSDERAAEIAADAAVREWSLRGSGGFDVISEPHSNMWAEIDPDDHPDVLDCIGQE